MSRGSWSGTSPERNNNNVGQLFCGAMQFRGRRQKNMSDFNKKKVVSQAHYSWLLYLTREKVKYEAYRKKNGQCIIMAKNVNGSIIAKKVYTTKSETGESFSYFVSFPRNRKTDVCNQRVECNYSLTRSTLKNTG